MPSPNTLAAPITVGFSVTPNDSADLSQPARELFFAAAGNVKVTWVNGATSTHAVLAGERLPWRVKRVWATGTTATGIEGFA